MGRDGGGARGRDGGVRGRARGRDGGVGEGEGWGVGVGEGGDGGWGWARGRDGGWGWARGRLSQVSVVATILPHLLRKLARRKSINQS